MNDGEFINYKTLISTVYIIIINPILTIFSLFFSIAVSPKNPEENARLCKKLTLDEFKCLLIRLVICKKL